MYWNLHISSNKYLFKLSYEFSSKAWLSSIAYVCCCLFVLHIARSFVRMVLDLLCQKFLKKYLMTNSAKHAWRPDSKYDFRVWKESFFSNLKLLKHSEFDFTVWSIFQRFAKCVFTSLIFVSLWDAFFP